MKQPINLKMEGHLKLTRVSQASREVLYDDHNALVANYKNIVRHAIAGDATHFIGQVKAFKANTLLATAPISGVTYIPLTDNEVKFTAIFDEASFDDTADEFHLHSNGGGQFSEVTGLSIAKDNQTQLIVEWTLKIINQ
jgi:hypothetical protein